MLILSECLWFLMDFSISCVYLSLFSTPSIYIIHVRDRIAIYINIKTGDFHPRFYRYFSIMGNIYSNNGRAIVTKFNGLGTGPVVKGKPNMSIAFIVNE